MKRILSILAIVSIVAAGLVPAAAAGYDVQNLLPATQQISGGATSNFTATATIAKATTALVQVQFKLSGAGTDNVIFNFKESGDGVNYPTAVTHTFTNAATGTTVVNALHPVTLKGGNTLRLVSIVNGVAAQAVTNLTVKVCTQTR